MKANNFIRSILVAELVLLAPLLAMTFKVEGVDWDGRDFLFASVLLAGIGVASQMIINGVKNNSRQVIIGVVIVVTILVVGAELAVGVFGSPFAGS